jgi:hypothetical protein
VNSGIPGRRSGIAVTGEEEIPPRGPYANVAGSAAMNVRDYGRIGPVTCLESISYQSHLAGGNMADKSETAHDEKLFFLVQSFTTSSLARKSVQLAYKNLRPTIREPAIQERINSSGQQSDY